MQTYHFDEVVNNEGIVTILELPPSAKVAIVVICPEPFDWKKELDAWREEMKTHPFAKMSKEDILVELRKTRERIAEKDYGNLPCE